MTRHQNGVVNGCDEFARDWKTDDPFFEMGPDFTPFGLLTISPISQSSLDIVAVARVMV